MKNKIIMLCSVLLLGACSSNTTISDSKETYLLFATPLKEHTIWLQAKEGFEKACSEYDIKCDWLGPTVIDTDAMSDVIATGIMQNASGIITQGVVDASLIDEADKVGIPMVLVDSDIPTSNRLAYIGKNFRRQAELILADVEEKYGKDEKLNVAIQVAEQSFAIAQEQIAEVEDVFASHPGGYEIVAISESKSEIVRARREWKNVMETHDEVNVALAFAAESASPCYEATMESNKREQVLIYGVDDLSDNLALVREGKIDGLIAASFYEYGYQSVKIMMEYLTTQEPLENKIIEPEVILVDKDNIDTYDKHE